MVTIYWSKMHVMNYDGSCAYCGGTCNSTVSVKNWELAFSELDVARYVTHNHKRVKYLLKMISTRQNYLYE